MTDYRPIEFQQECGTDATEAKKTAASQKLGPFFEPIALKTISFW